MNNYRYRIYYEWQGPSVSDMFAAEKTPDEIARAFERFPTEFEMRLVDRTAVAEGQPVQGKPCEIVLTVSTSATEAEVMSALIPTLQDWRLFATKLD